MLSYAAVEADALFNLAMKQRTKKLDGQTEGRAKQVFALALQSVNRHGQNVPEYVVRREVTGAIKRAMVAQNPFIALILPFIAQWIAQIAPVIIQWVIDWIKGLETGDTAAKRDAYRVSTLAMFAAEAQKKWNLG